MPRERLRGGVVEARYMMERRTSRAALMDYHLPTKKCDGMCDSKVSVRPLNRIRVARHRPVPRERLPGWCDEHSTDPALKPDIDALKSALQKTRLCRPVTGDRPPTPVGWSDTDWLKRSGRDWQDPERSTTVGRCRTRGGLMTLQDRIDELVAQHGSLRCRGPSDEIDVGYLSRLRAYANVNPGRDKLRRPGLRRVVAYELLRRPTTEVTRLGGCDMNVKRTTAPADDGRGLTEVRPRGAGAWQRRRPAEPLEREALSLLSAEFEQRPATFAQQMPSMKVWDYCAARSLRTC